MYTAWNETRANNNTRNNKGSHFSLMRTRSSYFIDRLVTREIHIYSKHASTVTHYFDKTTCRVNSLPYRDGNRTYTEAFMKSRAICTAEMTFGVDIRSSTGDDRYPPLLSRDTVCRKVWRTSYSILCRLYITSRGTQCSEFPCWGKRGINIACNALQ